jgi:hypothetical protein
MGAPAFAAPGSEGRSDERPGKSAAFGGRRRHAVPEIGGACVAAGVPSWTPNRLRHNAASVITERESIEVA